MGFYMYNIQVRLYTCIYSMCVCVCARVYVYNRIIRYEYAFKVLYC